MPKWHLEALSQPLVLNYRWRRLNVWRFGWFLSWNCSLHILFVVRSVRCLVPYMRYMSEASYWCNDAWCSRSVREVKNVDSEELLYIISISALSWLNKVLLHTHFYTKSSYLSPLYLPLHFWHIAEDHLVHTMYQNTFAINTFSFWKTF